MASIKISQLTAAASVTGTQEFEINDSGTSKKVTGSQIKTFVKDAFAASDITGLTATVAELNILDGVTATTAELNQLDTNTFTADITIPDKIIHAGDTNTAIRFPAADTVTVETSGAERMRIDSSGNVGVGTAPSVRLHVSSGANDEVARFEGTGNPYISLYDSGVRQAYLFAGAAQVILAAEASKPLTLEAGGAERVRIGTAGQIGIGGANYGTSGQVLTSGGSGAAPSWASLSVVNYQVFTSGSGTWTKPSNLSAGAIVIVEMWGAGGGGGGGGSSYRGGGGGGFATENFLASSLGSTETVTVGAGGAGGGNPGSAGGNSTFGSVLTAFGGGGGMAPGSGNRFGGGGGGHLGAGASNGSGGALGGGVGGGTLSVGDPIAVVDPDVYGGGGGGGGPVFGGRAAYGGGGGGGSGPTLGGVSKIAGSGGAGAVGTGVAGTAPAGGGGGGSTTGGAGARGEVRVWTIG